MKTMERRPDGAFEAWLRGVSGPMLRWMEGECLRPRRGLAASTHERAADETMARWLVREHLREVWEGSDRARAEEAAVLAAAIGGALDAPPELREPTRRLAEAVRDGDLARLPRRIREVCEPLVPDYPWDRPVEARTPCSDGIPLPGPARIVFLAGRLLRDGGALEEAHAAYHWSGRAWRWYQAPGASDDGLRALPWAWRWGIPSWDGTQAGLRVPTTHRFDWAPYDHVVGIGTTIRHRTLDLLGVPFDKQHIVESHRWLPRLRDGSLPRLSGRVAVVDDVHEGQTALTLARLYDADVVDVGVEGCTWAVSRAHPVCVVEDDRVQGDVYRRR